LVEGWDGNQRFSLNSQARTLTNPESLGEKFYPAMFEITGVIPEPILS
jgi:hypothetical protein